MRTTQPLPVLRRGGLLLWPLLALLFFASNATAQEIEGPLNITQVIVADDGKSVQAIVSLVDADGNPVRTPTDFEAQIDGKGTQRADVLPIVDERAGLSVLLLLDVSGSMDGEPIIQARAAASTFIDGLLASDTAAIAGFAGSAPTSAAFTGDHAALLASIAALQIDNGAGTALYDSMIAGVGLIARAPSERRAIILLTDGRDLSEGAGTAEQAVAAAADAGLPVYTIGLGENLDVEFLQQLATQSGGGFYLAPEPSDMTAVFETLSESLRSQYVLTVPLTPADTANRTLLVSTSVDGVVETSTLEFLAPQAATGAISDDSGGVPAYVWLLIPAGAAAILLPLAARAWSRRGGRQRRGAVRGGQAGDAPKAPATGARPGAGAALEGTLVVVDGPNAGLTLAVGEAPVEIGSGPGCDLRLDGESGAVATAHVRAWLKRDRLMVHHVARTGSTQLRGKPIEWASLAPEEAITIGPHTIRFQLQTPA